MDGPKDRIEKRVHLRAPRARVWRALTESQEFGAWFKVSFEQPFVPGVEIKGRITHPGYEHLVIGLLVEKMEPERYFSYRWHPHAVDPTHDYSREPRTLVEFTLEESAGGTTLTVAESGFEGIPLTRRAEALKGNDSGWAHQVTAIGDYLRRHP